MIKREEFFLTNGVLQNVLRIKTLTDFVIERLTIKDISRQQYNQLKGLIKKENQKIRQRWMQKCRRHNTFLKPHENWLCEYINFVTLIRKQSITVGRPQKRKEKKSFGESSSKTKNRKKNLLQNVSPERLAYATEANLRASGRRDGAKLIKEIVESSPKRATKFKKSSVIKQQRPYNTRETYM